MYRIGSLAQLLRQGDPERARHQFETQISQLRHGHLFYDGGPGGQSQTLQRTGLRITYSGRDSADNALITFIRQHHRPTTLTAVTGDRDLQLRLRALSVKVMPAERFIRQHVRSAAPRQQAVNYDDHLPNAQETQQWLQLFTDHARNKNKPT